MAKLSSVQLRALRASLRPETWEARVKRAEEDAAIVAAIDKARSEGATEDQAWAQVAPGLHPSTYHGRRRRWKASGVKGFINKRPGFLPQTGTPVGRYGRTG